ncbi:MAG: hypothetical protein KKC46_20790 [Proteobacteria bacterium]|nr:hypothetical protein [Pseudomonadota bacterium]
MGEGADHVVIRDESPVADGLLVVFGEGGTDTLDASAWNADLILVGDDGAIEYSGDQRPGSIVFIKSTATTTGDRDILSGGSGNDILIGGAGGDMLEGKSGNDILIGDGGRVSWNGQRCIIESINPFTGGSDFMDGGAGNDIMIGGYGNDNFTGSFNEDIMVGEYAYITMTGGLVDMIASNHFGNDVMANALGNLYKAHEKIMDTPGQADIDALLESMSTQPPPGRDKISMNREMLFAEILKPQRSKPVAHHYSDSDAHTAEDVPMEKVMPITGETEDRAAQLISLYEQGGQESQGEENADVRSERELDQVDDSEESSPGMDRLAAVMAGLAGWGVGPGDYKKTQGRTLLDRGGFAKLKDDERKRHFFKWNDGKFLSRVGAGKTFPEPPRHEGIDAR